MTAPRVLLLVLAMLVLLAAPALAASQEATPAPPRPPSQPATGPGGAEYTFRRVRVTSLGEEAGGGRLFEPVLDPASAMSAASGSLPLVLLIDGCCASGGRGGGDAGTRVWIDHLVRRGAIVIAPIYQLETAPTDVLAAVRTALGELELGGHAMADRDRMAVIGLSTGGVQALKYAAAAATADLPIPRALVIGQPGGLDIITTSQLATITPTTRMLVLVGDADTLEGDVKAQFIWRWLAVPLSYRDYITVASDDHGQPALIADHFVSLTDVAAPDMADVRLDALDWYGTWKLTDALMACAFTDEWCAYALGNTPEQRFMGTWSDGEPVVELQVTDDPTLKVS